MVERAHEDTQLLSKLKRLMTLGEDTYGEWEAERQDGIAVWEGKFRGTPDGDTFYYPMVYALLRHYIRSVRKTYTGASEIVSVSPLARKAKTWEVKVAEYQQEEINYHLHRWNDFLTFLDDTTTQVTKIGVCYGKVWWEQEREEESFDIEEPPNYEINDEGESVEKRNFRTETKEKITRNELKIDWVDSDDILHDDKKKWSDVEWVIHQNIMYSADDLLDKIDLDGWHKEAVERLISNKNPEDQEVPEYTQFKTAEFWGRMAIPEEDEKGDLFTRTKYVKICYDMDTSEILAGPTDVYKYADTGKPMINFSAGYFIRREGEIRGDSYCNKLKNYQAENNMIRNQRRKSVENDLNEKYVVQKDAEVEFEELEGSPHGTIIAVEDINGFKEVRHWDNTSSSYNELEAVRRDIVEMTGISEYALGMVDAHMTDTLGGIQLMSTASNTVIFDNIVSYNLFLEDLLTKGLHLSLQYLTIEELQADGVDLPQDITREDMKRSLKLRLDTGQGATSEQVELNNLMKAYFITQNFMNYCLQYGIEPGEARYYPAVLLNKMLPLLNVKDADVYIPDPKLLEQNTKEMIAHVQKQQAEAEEKVRAAQLEGAGQEGLVAGLQQQQAQGGAR